MNTAEKKYLIYCEAGERGCEEYLKNDNNIPVYYNGSEPDYSQLKKHGWMIDECQNFYCKNCSKRLKIKGKTN